MNRQETKRTSAATTLRNESTLPDGEGSVREVTNFNLLGKPLTSPEGIETPNMYGILQSSILGPYVAIDTGTKTRDLIEKYQKELKTLQKLGMDTSCETKFISNVDRNESFRHEKESKPTLKRMLQIMDLNSHIKSTRPVMEELLKKNQAPLEGAEEKLKPGIGRLEERLADKNKSNGKFYRVFESAERSLLKLESKG